MRAVVQRVSQASVRVDGGIVGQCQKGLLLLVGVHKDDKHENAERLATKIANLRIFSDPSGKMNLAISEVGGQILAVSNFTVFGDASKSRRPSFTDSAPFDKAQELFDLFVALLKKNEMSVQTGVFGVDMQVALINDGPVTLIVDA